MLTAMIFVSALPQKYDLKVDVLQEDIIVEKVINTMATNELREAAADAVPKKYTLDHNNCGC